jgi:hypothetical protein|tara:strand:+ start:164 stop:481 length:318 start_codon:yes stop_codon:yes gene_type:complete
MTRNKVIKLTLNDEEFRNVSDRAYIAGLSLASLTRSAALGLPIPQPKLSIDRQAVAALNRVGNNLNQITRIAHTEKMLTPDQIEALGTVLQNVDTVTQRIAGPAS